MLILPVLDLKSGLVVRGVAGQRHDYQPVCSCLVTSAQPLAVAQAFRLHFNLHELYVADLDAIGGHPPATNLYAELVKSGFHLWVDAGLHAASDATPLAKAGVAVFLAGLETLAGPDTLTALCQQYGPDRVVFSLDLKGGQPLGRLDAWGSDDPRTLAERAYACGVRRMLLLDLSRVGVNKGTGTEDLCTWLLERFPDVEVIAGGGVRDANDLHRLKKLGIHAVLIASALHDGRLTRQNLDEL